jgi:5'-methylthioadenosine phosphorylase
MSAVGSLREEIEPGHLVLVDQFIDRTRARASHLLRRRLRRPRAASATRSAPPAPDGAGGGARAAGGVVHDGGTYVCMEGPAFSSRAESNLYRSWGASVIGMTNLPEAKLAREAELSYATLALSTDYDCWRTGHEEVSVDQVIAVLHANVQLAQRILRAAVPRIAAHPGPAPMHAALATAIITDRSRVPAHRVDALRPIIGKYFT